MLKNDTKNDKKYEDDKKLINNGECNDNQNV